MGRLCCFDFQLRLLIQPLGTCYVLWKMNPSQTSTDKKRLLHRSVWVSEDLGELREQSMGVGKVGGEGGRSFLQDQPDASPLRLPSRIIIKKSLTGAFWLFMLTAS